MSSYFDKFSEWGRKAKEKAKELDDKYNLSEKVEQTVKTAEKVAGEAIRKGEEVAKEASQVVSENVPDKVTDTIKQAAEGTAKLGADALRTGAGKAAEKASEAAEKAGEAAEKAAKVYSAAKETYGAAKETAKEYYTRAEDAYDFGARATRASFSTIQGLKQAKDWIEENPGKSVLIGLAAVAGLRLGAVFPGLDKIIFGTSRHWLFHSCLASVGITKLSEKFFEYLKSQETLLAEGKLSEAEAERVRFQRNAAKYVGAPLLGAFNIAVGTTLLAEIFSPGQIVGFPISIILGGNPVLETMWLFGNGVVCIYNGYELVMFALKDQEDVQKIVREIRALLPETSSASSADAA